MNSERIIELFNEAAERLPEEREAFLAASCRDQPELRQHLERLLRAGQAAAGNFLNQAVSGAMRAPALVTQKPGDKIGHYKLLQQIGEGGCGVVYMAEQEEPVRRMVALKVIKLGMDTKQVIARFEAERQALALMDHPNIAKVLEAGATDTGRPYFVMELVRGIKITDYCDNTCRLANGWTCLFRFARRFSTRIRKASFIATSSPRTSWSRCAMASLSPK